jgi:hypothetical protein
MPIGRVSNAPTVGVRCRRSGASSNGAYRLLAEQWSSLGHRHAVCAARQHVAVWLGSPIVDGRRHTPPPVTERKRAMNPCVDQTLQPAQYVI